jgi:acetolactate synthase-1/2/3 large subunit
MADVTGQITGIPGVCFSTLGPGATNLVSGVANAYLDRSPVLVFTGQLSTLSQPYANHQFIPLEQLFGAITKKVFTLSGQGTRRMIKEGFHLATNGPKGPVCFCVPSDVSKAKETLVTDDFAPQPEKGRPNPANDGLIIQAIETIHKAQKPLVILGIGVNPRKDPETVRKFIKKNRFPVMTTPKAKGVFSEADPLFLATAGGMMADDLVVDMILQADLAIGIGFDQVESDKIWHKEIDLLSINGYPIEYRWYRPYLEVVGDIKGTLDLLMHEDFSDHRWASSELNAFRERLQEKLLPSVGTSGKAFSTYQVIQATRKALSREVVVTTDVGAHKLLMGQTWECNDPLTFFMSNGLSSMGYGFPAAMAAKLSRPEVDVVCITGDGGFAMVLQDLETAVRLSLPLVVLVLQDESFALIEVIQKRRKFPKYGVNFGRINFASVAEPFGAKGIKLNSLEELPEILYSGLHSDRPTIIEIPIDSTEYSEQL